MQMAKGLLQGAWSDVDFLPIPLEREEVRAWPRWAVPATVFSLRESAPLVCWAPIEKVWLRAWRAAP